MHLKSSFCHEGVIRASRSDQKSLSDLEPHYCSEGVVAAALRPDTIPAPPDAPPDPATEFPNEQIRRRTRADKEPAEWDFWGEERPREETRKDRLLDALDRVTKSQANSELPYGYPQDHGLHPPYGDWGPLRKATDELKHPEFVPLEKEQPRKGQRLAVNLGVGRHPWDYLGFNSETAVRRPIEWDVRRRAAVGSGAWGGPFLGGFLLAAAILGLAVLIARWMNWRKAVEERGRTRVRFAEELAWKKDASELEKAM